MPKTFVNDDFKQALLDVNGRACQRHQTTPMSEAERHYIKELNKMISAAHQTNETLILDLERFLPTMWVDVRICGIRLFRRKSDLVAEIRAVLKAYPLSRLQQEEIQFLREALGRPGLEKEDLWAKLIRANGDLAEARGRKEELQAGNEALNQQLRDARQAVANQNKDILRLKRTKAALEARVTDQVAEIEDWEAKFARTDRLLANLMRQPAARAVLLVNEAEPLLPVNGR